MASKEQCQVLTGKMEKVECYRDGKSSKWTQKNCPQRITDRGRPYKGFLPDRKKKTSGLSQERGGGGVAESPA